MNWRQVEVSNESLEIICMDIPGIVLVFADRGVGPCITAAVRDNPEMSSQAVFDRVPSSDVADVTVDQNHRVAMTVFTKGERSVINVELPKCRCNGKGTAVMLSTGFLA